MPETKPKYSTKADWSAIGRKTVVGSARLSRSALGGKVGIILWGLSYTPLHVGSPVNILPWVPFYGVQRGGNVDRIWSHYFRTSPSVAYGSLGKTATSNKRKHRSQTVSSHQSVKRMVRGDTSEESFSWWLYV